MYKFALILSGCGSHDGSEIHESTMLMLALRQLGASYECFSLNKQQEVVIDFTTGKKMNETRNVLVESARIARGKVKDITNLDVSNFTGIILPGGKGAILNLSNYALTGDENYSVDSNLSKVLLEFKKQNKPICAACIAPMVLARVFKGITITVGSNLDIATTIGKLGNTHRSTKSGDICVDEKNKIITAPFYMLANDISIIYKEAYKIVQEAIKLAT